MAPALDVFALKYGTLQLISAVEAAYEFGVEPETSVLVLMRRLADNPCIGDFPWGSVDIVDDDANGPLEWRRLVRQRRYLRTVDRAVAGRPVDRLFLGLYSVETCGVANKIGADSVTLLDDGTSTVYRSRDRTTQMRAHGRARSRRLIETLRRAGGVDSRHLPSLRVYSMFEPELMPDDEFERCELRHYAGRMATVDADPALLWLFGSNITEMKHLDAASYASIVEGLVARASAEQDAELQVVYHPHPREHPDKVSALAAQIGCEVAEGGKPVEMRLLDAQQLPGAGIWSFPSSALVSTAKLTRDRLPCTLVSLRGLASWGPLTEVEEAITHNAPASLRVLLAGDLVDGPR